MIIDTSFSSGFFFHFYLNSYSIDFFLNRLRFKRKPSGTSWFYDLYDEIFLKYDILRSIDTFHTYDSILFKWIKQHKNTHNVCIIWLHVLFVLISTFDNSYLLAETYKCVLLFKFKQVSIVPTHLAILLIYFLKSCYITFQMNCYTGGLICEKNSFFTISDTERTAYIRHRNCS